MSDYLNKMNGQSQDHDMYQEIEKRNTLEGYKSYLEKYPNGMWVEEAKQHIERFIQNDHNAYQSAVNLDTKEAYEEYLKEYSDGLHKIESIAKINEFVYLEKDTNAYNEAKDKNTIASYEDYLSIYSNGLNVKSARESIDILKAKKQREDEEYARQQEIYRQQRVRDGEELKENSNIRKMQSKMRWIFNLNLGVSILASVIGGILGSFIGDNYLFSFEGFAILLDKNIGTLFLCFVLFIIFVLHDFSKNAIYSATGFTIKYIDVSEEEYNDEQFIKKDKFLVIGRKPLTFFKQHKIIAIPPSEISNSIQIKNVIITMVKKSLPIVFLVAIAMFIAVKSGTEKSIIPQSSWYDVSEQECTNSGGEMYEGVCGANWETASQICSSLGGRLPSVDELRKVITDCGGVVDDWNNNKNNQAYQSCYKNKGFSSNGYWSSTTSASDTSNAWRVDFDNGYDYWNGKAIFSYVRCVRSGQ